MDYTWFDMIDHSDGWSGNKSYTFEYYLRLYDTKWGIFMKMKFDFD